MGESKLRMFGYPPEVDVGLELKELKRMLRHELLILAGRVDSAKERIRRLEAAHPRKDGHGRNIHSD